MTPPGTRLARHLAAFLPALLFAGISCRMPEIRDEAAADRAAIEALHRKDMAASRARDVNTLLSLWTVDAVLLPPDGPPVIGLEEITLRMRSEQGVSDRFEVLEYVQDFQEVVILGDVAVEWGTYRGKMRSRSDGATSAGSGNLMRVLRKTDQGWKIARSIWTANP